MALDLDNQFVSLSVKHYINELMCQLGLLVISILMRPLLNYLVNHKVTQSLYYVGLLVT